MHQPLARLVPLSGPYCPYTVGGLSALTVAVNTRPVSHIGFSLAFAIYSLLNLQGTFCAWYYVAYAGVTPLKTPSL